LPLLLGAVGASAAGGGQVGLLGLPINLPVNLPIDLPSLPVNLPIPLPTISLPVPVPTVSLPPILTGPSTSPTLPLPTAAPPSTPPGRPGGPTPSPSVALPIAAQQPPGVALVQPQPPVVAQPPDQAAPNPLSQTLSLAIRDGLTLSAGHVWPYLAAAWFVILLACAGMVAGGRLDRAPQR
jgi:hypothetical protein